MAGENHMEPLRRFIKSANPLQLEQSRQFESSQNSSSSGDFYVEIIEENDGDSSDIEIIEDPTEDVIVLSDDDIEVVSVQINDLAVHRSQNSINEPTVEPLQPKKRKLSPDVEILSDSIPTQRLVIFCEKCDVSVPEQDWPSHERSISHMMDTNSKLANEPSFQIPKSNIGYQLLLKSGWTEGTALGKDNQGSLYPIKTHNKQDRCGLGHKRPKRSNGDCEPPKGRNGDRNPQALSKKNLAKAQLVSKYQTIQLRQELIEL